MPISEQSLIGKMRAGLIAAAFLFVLIMFAPISHAGGLGFAPLAVIAGIAGYLGVNGNTIRFQNIPIVFWALFGLVIWAIMTSSWSPYEDKQTLTNPVKLLLGAGLYSGVLLLPKSIKFDQKIIRRAIMAIGWITIGLLLFDNLTNYSLTYFIDPKNAGENPIHHRNTIYMNLSHSITVVAILTPLMITLFKEEFQNWKLPSMIWVLCVLAVSILGKIFVGGVALFAGLMFSYFALKNAKYALFFAISLAIFTILTAPIFGHLMNYVSPELKASLPASWEHRVEMWGYVSEKVAEKPLFGHGFDAARTFGETFNFRGHEGWTKVSLHPHNVGLHLWSETGAIGASLASLFLFGLGQALRPYVAVSSARGSAVIGFLAAALMVCTFTYGIWQEWWWGVLFLLSAFIALSFSKN